MLRLRNRRPAKRRRRKSRQSDLATLPRGCVCRGRRRVQRLALAGTPRARRKREAGATPSGSFGIVDPVGGAGGQCGPGFEAELVLDVLPVAFGDLDADTEFLGDAERRQGQPHRAENLQLAIAQLRCDAPGVAHLAGQSADSGGGSATLAP